jgi:hypothetical protein
VAHSGVEPAINRGERGMTMKKKSLSIKAGIKSGGIAVQHNRRMLRA